MILLGVLVDCSAAVRRRAATQPQSKDGGFKPASDVSHDSGLSADVETAGLFVSLPFKMHIARDIWTLVCKRSEGGISYRKISSLRSVPPVLILKPPANWCDNSQDWAIAVALPVTSSSPVHFNTH